MIGIRVDANEKIASGHVMRCLSIADAFLSLGEDVTFYTADTFGSQIIEKRGHRVICLESDWNDKESELPVLLPRLKEHEVGLLLVDSYQVTEGYLAALRQRVRLAYLDDLAAFDYPADLVINYAIGARREDYPEVSKTAADKAYLIGPSYAPLRKQFLIGEEELADAIRRRMLKKQILITTGAADPFRVADQTVRAILACPELDDYGLLIIKGRFREDLDDRSVALLADAKKAGRIRIFEDVDDMATLMLQSTFAVSAGGSTLYELSACLVPTVTFSYADNQFANVKGFSDKELMIYAGDVRDTEEIGSDIVKALLVYHREPGRALAAQDKMRKLCFRDGAERLARSLLASK